MEMIRQINVARDNAQTARTSAIVTLKTIIVDATPEIREQLDHLGDKALLEKCAGFRLGNVDGRTSSTKHTLRSLARPWVFLDLEIKGTTPSSTTSPRASHRRCETGSASDPTQPLRYSLSWVTIQIACATKRASRSSVVSHRFQRRPR